MASDRQYFKPPASQKHRLEIVFFFSSYSCNFTVLQFYNWICLIHRSSFQMLLTENMTSRTQRKIS